MRNCSSKVSISLSFAACAAIATAGGRGQQSNVVEIRVEKNTLPQGVRYEFSRTVNAGRLVKTSEGKPGYSKCTYRVTLKNGKVVSKELLKEERLEPETSVYTLGRGNFSASRGSYTRSKFLEVEATAYDTGAECNGGHAGRTKTGIPAAYGVIAVDPRVIPLGSVVFVEGYGMAIAGDTGGAIKGMRIDLCYNTRAEANRFGRKKVKIHVFQSR